MRPISHQKTNLFFYDSLRIFLTLDFFSENVFFFAETSNGIISLKKKGTVAGQKRFISLGLSLLLSGFESRREVHQFERRKELLRI